jgi:hypothetical protein
VVPLATRYPSIKVLTDWRAVGLESWPPEFYHSRDRYVRVWVPRAVPVLLTRSATHTA